MNRLTTAYYAHPRTGAGQIIARYGRRMRTIKYNHAFSAERNHEIAARALEPSAVLAPLDALHPNDRATAVHFWTVPSA